MFLISSLLCISLAISNLINRSSFKILIFFFSVTAPFYLKDSRRIQDLKRREWRSAWGGREREWEREWERQRVREERERESACTRERESERKRFGSSFYMFFLPRGLSNYAFPQNTRLYFAMPCYIQILSSLTFFLF